MSRHPPRRQHRTRRQHAGARTPDTASADPTACAGATARQTPKPRSAKMRPIASTRMAIQMAIALSAAFVARSTRVPAARHLGRTHRVHRLQRKPRASRRALQERTRIAGAAVGTIVASIGLVWLTPAHPFLQGPPLVIVLLAILGVGLWLREWTYAAWAVVMTLVITLLQGTAIHVAAGTGGEQLWIRILAIIVGAACGLAASWFVLPVRSEGVVRRRIADSLAVAERLRRRPQPDHRPRAECRHSTSWMRSPHPGVRSNE